MTRFEQSADDPYSRLDHMDGLGENLAHLPVEERRQFMEADTTPVPVQYEDRKSRHTSLVIIACLTGPVVAVFAWWAIFRVVTP